MRCQPFYQADIHRKRPQIRKEAKLDLFTNANRCRTSSVVSDEDIVRPQEMPCAVHFLPCSNITIRSEIVTVRKWYPWWVVNDQGCLSRSNNTVMPFQLLDHVITFTELACVWPVLK